MKINNLMSPSMVTTDTVLPITQGQCIHNVFEYIVGQNPDAEAVVHCDQSITYRVLNERVNFVTRNLIRKGIRKGDIVGVKLDKSIDLIVAILAVMKAGAAYLPLDPAYPDSRISYMLEDSKIRHLITSGSYTGLHKTITEINISELSGRLVKNTGVESESHDLAYVIYTSGTTGNPKGVMVGHAGFVNMCRNQIEVYELGLNERVLQFASVSFDASVYEIFIALLSGSTLVLVDKEVILDRNRFLQYLDRHELSFILLPPVFLNSLERPEFRTVRTIVTAGEACNVSDALYYSHTKRYFNAYGPTEASVCVSLYQVLPGNDYGNYIPIGKAIPNISFYILDENLIPVQEGNPGELYVGGIGLAKGYLNRPELTEKAFVRHPFIPEEIIYKTGDIVKMESDGNLVIFGRKDDQVKILGHRIETGAVENAIINTGSVTNAHVAVVEFKGEKFLCAYYTSAELISGEFLRNRLAEELPLFMIPNWFIQIPEFKLTNNGKIDKTFLPSPSDFFENQSESVVSSLSPEEKVLRICREVLGLRELDFSDNFFVLGGHSLKAARLVSRINKEFNVSLAVSDIYSKPHVSEIYEMIQTAKLSVYESVLPAEKKRYYAASAAQKRMYLMHCTDKVDVSYNVSVVLQFDYLISADVIRKALKVLSGRHEVLRTRFDIQFDDLVQEILPEAEIVLTEGGRISEADLEEAGKKFVQPFDLSAAPVMRAACYDISEGGTALIFDTHHIIADGTSMGILVKELVALLDNRKLPEIKLQYKDYAEWENITHRDSKYFEEHENYWIKRFADIPKLKMPADLNSDAGGNFAGERIAFTIGSELARKINSYALNQEVSVYQLLLSVYYLLLSKYTNQHDLVVGTAVANRNKEEFQQMMGMFVNTLALRTSVPAEIPFFKFVENIRNLVLESFTYQEYPFEALVSKLGLSGKAAKVPLVDTLFIVQNIDFFSDQNIQGLNMKYENSTATSKFDFSFFISEQKNQYLLEVEYNTGMFSREFITDLAQNFIVLTEKAIAAPDLCLDEISLIDDSKLSYLRNALKSEKTLDDVEFDL
jgi:fengycin family lipopeptide synthetase D